MLFLLTKLEFLLSMDIWLKSGLNFCLTDMAADSDGELIETVVTCEGDLKDPDFPSKFKTIVGRLKSLVCKGTLII